MLRGMKANPYVTALGAAGFGLALIGAALIMFAGGNLTVAAFGGAVLPLGVVGVFFWLHAAASDWAETERDLARRRAASSRAKAGA